jgi:hypothetical protein
VINFIMLGKAFQVLIASANSLAFQLGEKRIFWCAFIRKGQMLGESDLLGLNWNPATYQLGDFW